MNRLNIPSIPDPTSPWYQLSEWRKPNVKWCEAQNNSWIIEPANTWSNLAYITMGLFIANHSQKFKSKAIRSYAWVMIAMGLCSGIYHASYTFVLQILDFFGMYLMTYLMALIQMKRLGWVEDTMSPRNFWGLVMGTTIFTVWCDLYTNFPIQSIIAIQTLFILGSEALIWKRRTIDYPVHYFWFGAIFMFVAITFSALDVSRTMCNPNDHWIQGHALWHIFSSIGITLTYLHHSQFDRELDASPVFAEVKLSRI